MRTWIVLTALLTMTACSQPTPEPVAESTPVATPTILTPPFTAEEIRDQWSLGLQLTIRQTSPEGSEDQRWSVVEWSTDGCAIEYASLDADGNVIGESMVQQATWSELRDHAAFPKEIASRTVETRETPIGTFEGWLYEVSDPVSGGVTRFFFARDLAGAPLWVETTVNGQVVASMEQIARTDLSDAPLT